jgi:predicted Zn-dependent protease
MRRGLLVSDFWYTRILDPRTVVITGLTRNGVWLIEDGEITAPVSTLRFTQSYPNALAPGAVLGVGSDASAVPVRGPNEMVRSPSLHLAAWHITGGAVG